MFPLLFSSGPTLSRTFCLGESAKKAGHFSQNAGKRDQGEKWDFPPKVVILKPIASLYSEQQLELTMI